MTIVRRGLAIAAPMLLAVGCGDEELPTAGSEVPSTILSTVRTTTTSDTTPESPRSMQSSTATSDTETTLSSTPPTTLLTSSSLDLAADPVAGVLAAAAAYWLSSHATFTTRHVVERLGEERANLPSVVEFNDNAPQMTDLQRSAIEAALAPRLVRWTHDLESVAGPAMTVPPDQAVVMFAEPTIDGGHAEIVVNLWCGMLCGGGITLVIERSGDEWAVTEQFDGFGA